MAIINPIHGELSGSIGGNTYSRNRGGSYVRRRVKPDQGPYGRQGVARAALASLSGSFNSLTQVQIDQWNNYAENHLITNALGLSIRMTGHQAYVALNSNLLQSGQAPLSSPPSSTIPAPFLTLSAAVVAPDALTVTFTPAIAAGSVIQVWQSIPGNKARNPGVNQKRLVAYSAVDDTSPLSLTLRFPGMAGQTVNIWANEVDANGRAVAVQFAGRLTF